jgi:hypothetical protein
VDIHQAFTRIAALALACHAVWTAPSCAQAALPDRLGVFLAGVIKRLDATGALDLSGYACETVAPDLQECIDRATGLAFLHLPSPKGAHVSLTVIKGSAPDGKDLTLPDRASGDRMLAAFKALPETALAGRDRCALLEGATDTQGLVLGFKVPLGSSPVYLIHGGLDDQALAALDRPGAEGVILSAVLVSVVADRACTPLP